MTEFERRMLELREREVAALEKQAEAARLTELRNGRSNRWIGDGYTGRWAFGIPDREANKSVVVRVEGQRSR